MVRVQIGGKRVDSVRNCPLLPGRGYVVRGGELRGRNAAFTHRHLTETVISLVEEMPSKRTGSHKAGCYSSRAFYLEPLGICASAAPLLCDWSPPQLVKTTSANQKRKPRCGPKSRKSYLSETPQRCGNYFERERNSRAEGPCRQSKWPVEPARPRWGRTLNSPAVFVIRPVLSS